MDDVLRNAERKDAERINELFVEMCRTIHPEDDTAGYGKGYLDKFFAGKDDRICVAERDQEIVAFLSVEVYRAEGYIYLDDFCVTEKCRNHGIGTRLLQEAEAYAQCLGIQAIVLHVEKTNESAHRLYLRCGYKEDAVQGSRIRMVKVLH